VQLNRLERVTFFMFDWQYNWLVLCVEKIVKWYTLEIFNPIAKQLTETRRYSCANKNLSIDASVRILLRQDYG